MNLLLVGQRLGYHSTTTYSYELAGALLGRGHKVKLCTTGGDLRDWFQKGGIDLLPVRFNLFSFRRLLKYLEEFNPDLIHVQNLRSLPLGRRLSERLRRQHLVTVHHVPGARSPNLPHFLLAAVVAVNEDIRESLVNDHGIPKELIRVIAPGINLERFRPGEAAPSPGKDRLPVVGSIGRLDPLKGFDSFLTTARKVLDFGREAMFVIVGEGDEERNLRRRVKDLKIEKYVIFAPPMPDIVDLYRGFDVVVVPTLRGGVGLTALEAMALAKPVVATKVGEILNVVVEGRTGFLIPEGDSDQMAACIIRLLDHPEEAAKLGRAARKRVEELYSLPSMVGATEALYREILEDAENRSDTSFQGSTRRSAASS